MNSLKIIIFCFLCLSYSCKVKEYEKGKDIVVNTLKADKASYDVEDETIHLKLQFQKAYQIELEYLASIALVTFYDQSYEKLNKEGIKYINVTVKHPTDEKTFQYAVNQIPYYKSAINNSALFIENFLKSNMESNLQYVNTNILPKEKLLELNQIAATIMVTNKIEDYTFDGFKLDPKENLLQTKVILNADKELLKVTIQVQLATSKISYFGINDDL